jgi:tRNA nucleotidyltransferase (CCA-adding enzyme)
MSINNTAKLVCETLQNSDFQGFLVGGSVRDMLLNMPVHDIDITTNAFPCEIKNCFRLFKQFNLGEKFGTITVIVNGEKVEITTFRTESQFTDKRNELNIGFVSNLEEDLKRRDLTVNALALNPCTGELIDLFGGKNDLENHIIRFVGIPEDRIREDPLRMLRAIRFSAKLNSVIESESFNAIRLNKKLIHRVAKERIMEELLKILSIKDCFFALENLLNTGLLNEIIPELARLENIKQPKKFHKFNVLHHSFMTVLNLPENNPILRLTGLLHDLGKTEARLSSPFFPNHELKGTEIFNAVAKRLKLSVKDTHKISFLIENHMIQFGFPNIQNNHNAQKRLLSKMGADIEFLGELFSLFRADKDATGKEDLRIEESTNAMQLKLNAILANKEPLQVKDLAIKGTDLINLGLPLDSTLSKTLKMLLDSVLNGETENTNEALLSKTKSLINSGAI